MLRAAALIAALMAGGFWQEPAAAATATLEYEEPIPGVDMEPLYALSVEDGPGEPNLLTVSHDGDGYTVRDESVPLQPGAGCEAVATDTVRCPTPDASAAHTAFVAAGSGNDRIVIAALPETTFVEAHAGAGADSIVTGPGRDLLVGGSGADLLAGGLGDDRLVGGLGDDRLDGGDGIDRVLYEKRRAPIRVDLAAGTGGEAGEADEITGVEEIFGGRASDDLAGDEGPNLIIGGFGEGRDSIAGRGGDDILSGHRVSGGGGDDSLGAIVVSCGAGNDLVSRGPKRNPRGPFPPACERALAIFAEVTPDPVRRSGRWVEYGVACRAPVCTGTLELRDRRGRLGRKHFRLRHGDDPAALHRVRVPLSRRPAQRVAKLWVNGPRAYQRDWFRTRVVPRDTSGSRAARTIGGARA